MGPQAEPLLGSSAIHGSLDPSKGAVELYSVPLHGLNARISLCRFRRGMLSIGGYG
jgi:hypothetical protein